jgi:hypothetical protein
MMKPGLMALGLLALAGCGSVEAQLSCTSQYTRYGDAWNCIRAKEAAGLGGLPYDDLTAHYLARGDALAQAVQVGKLTDLQAKNLLDMELVHRKGIDAQRLVDGIRPVPTFVGYYDYYYYFY